MGVTAAEYLREERDGSLIHRRSAVPRSGPSGPPSAESQPKGRLSGRGWPPCGGEGSETAEAGEPGYVVIRQADAAMFARQVDCLVAAVAAMRQEVEALKAESARRVTINHQQAKSLAARMRERAEQLCIKHGLDPQAHAAAFRAAVKRAVLDDMGIEDLHDLPLSGLDAARARIDTWDSWTLARKRKRIEEERHGAAD